MCELGVFPIFFQERLFKSQQNPSIDFFKSRKRLWRIKNVFVLFCFVLFFFIYRSWFFFPNAMFTTPVYNSRRRGRFVNSAFLTRNVLPPKNSSNRAAMSTLYRKNDTTNLSGYKLGEWTGNEKKKKEKGKKALLFFSGKKTVQNFNGSVWTITPLFCEVIISRIDLVTDFQRYLDE